jgi:hypothetical protein
VSGLAGQAANFLARGCRRLTLRLKGWGLIMTHRVTARALVLAVVTSVIGFGTVLPAFAAAGNDTIGTALGIPSLPFAHTENTASATADPADPPAECAVGPNVWFKFKATRAERLTASAAGSNYGVELDVYQGRPTSSSFPIAGCSSAVDFVTTPGVTYFIQAMRCCDTGPDFNLIFHLVRVPKISGATVNAQGTVRFVDGVATVSGTVTCSRKLDASVFIHLAQRISKTYVATGDNGVEVPNCSRTATRWSVQLAPGSIIAFAKGPAAATLFASGCDKLGSCSDQITRGPVTIQLNWAATGRVSA